ncbi:hypothetical protein BQ8794_320096 [Mesorhizobium prunaredense]|uniref:Uncharacterized protein n=1 Tax=Mesorhizobium prunaredense TaxID=1631249 RepID=A0A1R3VDF0_9HYPH|nr:hypothetical protein BQ8794_320096 [Mesorhizobium prunaredense]
MRCLNNLGTLTLSAEAVPSYDQTLHRCGPSPLECRRHLGGALARADYDSPARGSWRKIVTDHPVRISCRDGGGEDRGQERLGIEHAVNLLLASLLTNGREGCHRPFACGSWQFRCEAGLSIRVGGIVASLRQGNGGFSNGFRVTYWSARSWPDVHV